LLEAVSEMQMIYQATMAITIAETTATGDTVAESSSGHQESKNWQL
jgi:hypothetical protein